MRPKLTLVIFLYLISIIQVIGQTDQYKFTCIDIRQGLSNNLINCVFKDSKGFIWIGTMSGLNRYDGYTFKIFRHNLNDTTSINDNYIIKVVEDHEGKLWIQTRNGFNVFDPETEIFSKDISKYLPKGIVSNVVFTDIFKDQQGNLWFISQTGIIRYLVSRKEIINIFHKPNDSATVLSNDITSITEDSHGDFWLINRSGLMEKLDGKTNRIIYRNSVLQKSINSSSDFSAFIDSDDDLWIFTSGGPNGIFYYKSSDQSLSHIHKDSETCRLNTNIVKNVLQDNKGNIWIGTDHGGINLLNKRKFTIQYLVHNPDDEKSLSQNTITTLYKDNTGIIWAGTYKKGVNYYHESIIKFNLFKHQASNPYSLSYDDVNCFVEDDKGNLWIGTNGGGLLYFNRNNGTFSKFVHVPHDPYSLSNDVIVSLCIDRDKKLWIGTYFGGLNCYDGKKFICYKHNLSDPRSIADDRVWKILEDNNGNLWIGSLGGGLMRFDRNKKEFYRYPKISDYIMDVAEDQEGNLWIGTADGIYMLDTHAGQVSYVIHNDNLPNSLSNNNIISLIEDSRGLIWVGTREGLNLLNKKKNIIKIFRIEDGLPDNTIQTILEDNNGNLWIGTPNGLSNIIIRKAGNANYTFSFNNYDELDGLQGKEFNEKAAYKTSKGELVFGGANGFNLFLPNDIKINKFKPVIVFTELQIFNKNIRVNEKVKGRVILAQSISRTKEITLKYGDNVFSIGFAALSYFNPVKNKYAYILEGFNKEWLTTDEKSRKATYTNLNPGQYMFRVKASNNDGIWNNDGISIKITILPPFWRTRIAFVIYFIVICITLFLSRLLILKRARLKFMVEQEKQESQRRHELDMMKIKFFTNISHEFRTPLTLIITPLDKLLKNVKDQDLRQQLLLIYRNARRLLNLINQLLDFRRLEVQEFRLITTQGDIVKFIKDLVLSFSDLSEKKNILFSFSSNIQELETYFDQDKLEKIIFNLLSNAFKFTPEHGSISVEVEFQGDERQSGNNKKFIEIRVKDTGIGIPPEKHEKIFERFFQVDVPGNIINQGSGIGLALTKEFVKLHGGNISVQSENGKGSCFIVSLPLEGDVKPGIAKEASSVGELADPEKLFDKSEEKTDQRKSTVLLVEDNEDFRFYLKDNLKSFFYIIEAANGKEGWHQMVENTPDLVVSDIMMPEMDGIELCRKIKDDKRTSHVPVILLTARTSEEQKLEGFNMGADEYVTKPFNFEILELRIKNLINQREILRKAFQKQIVVSPSEISVTSIDEKIIQKAIDLVEKNMSNPDFSVEELSRELGMSRVHLYKKLLSLTGKTPIEFIRILRLKRATQFLLKSQLTVSEVAYKVGFNNPKYFTKYFKEEFHVLPSMYKEQQDKVS